MQKRVNGFAGRRLPELHAPVEAGRSQPPTARTECQRSDGELMRRPGVEQLTCFRVPNALAHSSVAARRWRPAVAERHENQLVVVPRKGLFGTLGPFLLPAPAPTPPPPPAPKGRPAGGLERTGIRRPSLARAPH